ncbi:symmetrical bis(5'-nucleosyl)-tetraphosphatase [Paraglaciecola sp. 2405UD69-4]|uniref:symmetrical bis(5'-nucleosyl)-tetraphosphatase n=1 Tax=Paraglaciecola sp. 2405UD69-4 TaxID=3391836 RepID=UPI0039C8F057
MATYIVGDIQGCLSGLLRLLSAVGFKAEQDKLIAVGDLIGRGPQALETIEYLYSLGSSFDTVLGNHDLHLLAIHAGIRKAKPNDKLDTLLADKNIGIYIDWLRRKPLALKPNEGSLITHAGLYPDWSIKQALAYSNEVSEYLAGDQWQLFLANMYGNQPNVWHESLSGFERLRFIVNALTRMRFIKHSHTLDFDCKSAPEHTDSDLTPWFACENHQLKSTQQIIFGHWAALNGVTENSQIIGLDTGYIWGNNMTLLDLSKSIKHSVKYKDIPESTDT